MLQETPRCAWPDLESGFSRVDIGTTTFRVLSAPVISDGSRVGVFQAAVDTSLERGRRRRGSPSRLRPLGCCLWPSCFRSPTGRLGARWHRFATWRTTQQTSRMHAPGSGSNTTARATSSGLWPTAFNEMLDRFEHTHEEQRRFVGRREPRAAYTGGHRPGERGTAAQRAHRLRRSRRVAGHHRGRDSANDSALDELLSLARLDGTRRAALQPLELRSLLEEAAARTSALGDRQIEVEGPCPLWIEGDPDLLDQVFANLVRNAIAPHRAMADSIDFTCERMQTTTRSSASPTTDRASPRETWSASSTASTERPVSADPSRRRRGAWPCDRPAHRRAARRHDRAENVEPHGARFTIIAPRDRRSDGSGTT